MSTLTIEPKTLADVERENVRRCKERKPLRAIEADGVTHRNPSPPQPAPESPPSKSPACRALLRENIRRCETFQAAKEIAAQEAIESLFDLVA